MDDHQFIYLDNNATTPIDSRVLEAMMPFLTNNFSNANSIHEGGRAANEATKRARKQIADLIGSAPNEISFTSGATEAINLAIKGVAEQSQYKGNHIVTITTEHNAVLDTCAYLETKGYEVTYLAVQPDGLLDLDVLQAALRNDTILVSVMYANNETGVIQSIKEIVDLVHNAGALFLCDATQAVGKIVIDVAAHGIDLLSLSGHKFYAPKGIGALYVRQGLKLPALLHGGGHEKGLRSGTLNVPGIVALGAASAIAQTEMEQDAIRIGQLRDQLEQELLKIPGTFVNGHIEERLYNVTNICFPGQDANVIIGRLKNIALSNGSACTAAIIEPSHVLKAMGLSDEDAFAAIRFSLGRFNTESDIVTTTEMLNALMLPTSN